MSIKSAKQKAWREFSRFIRLRDCIRTTGSDEYGLCITCGKRVPFKSSQAGHFIAGRTNAVLFNEDIVHLQCYGCNVCKHGEQLEYYYAMKKLGYTEEQITEFRKLRHKTVKYKESDYKKIAETYSNKYKSLLDCYKIEGFYNPRTFSLSSLPSLDEQLSSLPWV